jgi:hypothetical protein
VIPIKEIRVPSHSFGLDVEGVQVVWKMRQKLMRTTPIVNKEISRLDRWLLERPKLPLAVSYQIWTRLMLVSSIEYEREENPVKKHMTLLELRDHYDWFRELPEKWQEALRPHWLEWLDVLQTENEKHDLEEIDGAA